MTRIGVINIDTSHPLAFATYLEQGRRARYAAIYNDGFRGDDEVEGFITRFGLEKRCDSIEELADSVDIGFIQGCNWDKHLKQAMPFMEKGKPVFIDKPIAGTLADCKKLEELARKGKVILGSSAARYAEEVVDFRAHRKETVGDVLNVFGTAGVDEFNYGIHIVEVIGGMLGTGAVSNTFVGGTTVEGKTCESFYVRYADGKTITYNTFQGLWQPFEVVVMGTKGTQQFRIDTTKIYAALLDRICDFMETGKNDLAAIPELTESVKIMLAGRISRERDGEEVTLADIPEDDPGYDGEKRAREYAATATKTYLNIPKQSKIIHNTKKGLDMNDTLKKAAVGLFGTLFLFFAPRAASGQDAIPESWWTGEEALPEVAGDAPKPAGVLVRYWEPDTPNRIAREWGALLGQAQRARELGAEGELLDEIERDAARVVKAAGGLKARGRQPPDPALLHYTGELAERLVRRRAALNKRVTGAAEFSVGWVEPYSEAHRTVYRSSPGHAFLPSAEPVRDWDLLVLSGEHRAAALLVVNTTAAARKGSVMVQELDPERFALEARRHVFVEDWYRRYGQRRTVDPLPRLEESLQIAQTFEGAAEAWSFEIPPGGTMKLQLEIFVRPGAAGAGEVRMPVRVEVEGADPEELSLTLRVPAAPAPDSGFEHLSFIYPFHNLQGRLREETAADLAAHGVGIFEFPHFPMAGARFDDEGNLLSADFDGHLRLLEPYLAQGIRPFLFWRGNLHTADGEVLKSQSPEWARAYTSLVSGFLDEAAKLGYGPENFTHMPVDEPHGARGAKWAEAFRIIKERLPEIPVVTTIPTQCSPALLELLAPHIDIFVPQWSGAFNPKLMPRMEKRRVEGGARILSYRVAQGPADPLLGGNRAYPIIAVGRGFTGISHWAYNDYAGSTWHPWDGARQLNLDYTFVYDGTEKHPFNQYWNPTGESIVPSIRWQAVRAGVQDARLLVWLREQLDAGNLAEETSARAKEALEEARALAFGERELTDAGVARLSRELHEIYAAAAAR